MQKNNIFYYTGLISCIALLAVCFLPWVHYNSINETFTGWHVTRFATGVYYGRPGMFISIFTGIILVVSLWQNNTGNRINLFLSAIVFAYTIRTFILFTGSMFEGEVTKLAGIYLIMLLSGIMLLCSVFPRTKASP